MAKTPPPTAGNAQGKAPAAAPDGEGHLARAGMATARVRDASVETVIDTYVQELREALEGDTGSRLARRFVASPGNYSLAVSAGDLLKGLLGGSAVLDSVHAKALRGLMDAIAKSDQTAMNLDDGSCRPGVTQLTAIYTFVGMVKAASAS